MSGTPPPTLTLILAASVPHLGIGLNGALPWRLSRELKYFKQVTTARYPAAPSGAPGSPPAEPSGTPGSPPAEPSGTPGSPPAEPSGTPGSPPAEHDQNVVIMGRRTWDSLPRRMRPLPGRINVVLTARDPQRADAGARFCASLDQALEYVDGEWERAQQRAATHARRVFVIGGAQVYAAALRSPRASRILLTEVVRDGDQPLADSGAIECDTFLGPEEGFTWYPHGEPGVEAPEGALWRRASVSELRRSLPADQVDLPEATDEYPELVENGFRYRFTLWTKVEQKID